MRRRRPAHAKADDLAVGLKERGLLDKLRDLVLEYGVTLTEVLAGRKSQRVVMARDACIMKLLAGARMSTVETGVLLGMHHTSIMAARARYLRRDNGRLLT